MKKTKTSKTKSKKKTSKTSRRPSISRAKAPKTSPSSAPSPVAATAAASPNLCKCGCGGSTANTFIRGHYGTYLNQLSLVVDHTRPYETLPAQVRGALKDRRAVVREYLRLKPMGNRKHVA